MKIREFMELRQSTREYKDSKLKKKEIAEVQNILKEVNDKANEFNVEFNLYIDEEIFNSLEGEGGYSGVMIKAPAYISLNMKELSDEAYIYGAYYLEDIIGKLSMMEFGTCWISLFSVDEELKKKVFNTNDTIDFILAFGKPTHKSILDEDQYSNRASVEDLVFFDDFNNNATIEKLENYGLDEIFYYLRFAPSAFNKQPWRFLIKDGKIDLYIENYKGNVNLTDSGIVMYYYEKLAELMGITATWDLEATPVVETDKKFIGRTNF